MQIAPKKNKRECPECREWVDSSANYCPFCRYEFVKPVTDKTTKLVNYSESVIGYTQQPQILCSGFAVYPTNMTYVYEQIENCNDRIYITRAQYYELLKDTRTFRGYNDPQTTYFCGKKLIVLD